MRLAFTDLYNHSMPQHPKHFRVCLDRVVMWEPSVIHDEIEQLRREYPDIQECFKQVYVSYVKAMRGGARVKLMVNMPRLDDFLTRYFVLKHRFVQNALLSELFLARSARQGLDATRDALFEFLGEEHVKLEDRSVVSDCAPSQTSNARSQREERDSARMSGRATSDPTCHANLGGTRRAGL